MEQTRKRKTKQQQKEKHEKNKTKKHTKNQTIFELDILVLKCSSDFFFIYLFFYRGWGIGGG